MVAERGDKTRQRVDRDRMTPRADGRDNAMSRNRLVRSRGEELQDAVFDNRQTKSALPDFGRIRPRIDDLLLGPEMPALLRAPLDAMHVVDDDITDFGKSFFRLRVEHDGIIRGWVR